MINSVSSASGENVRSSHKICIVSSCGGHLTEVRALKATYQRTAHFYVLNARINLPADMAHNTYFIRHSERDWLFFVNLWEAWRILKKEQPSLILSTGAGLVVPFALVGKLYGISTIYIEISTQVLRPSLSGRIMYYVADRFFYQWKPLGSYFPKGTYGGLLQWSS
ncbi:MAG TPA: PssD/Cps14F family polysaccharide biosynthesis glycosyltransferase [Nitrospiraceae bacterium]|nr:PssD/Cps14F family polysaccharide biosynthesis glycosyltransferase [Nitrospiraceae bacterium]